MTVSDPSSTTSFGPSGQPVPSDLASPGRGTAPRSHRGPDWWKDEEQATLTLIDQDFRRTNLSRKRSLEQFERRLGELVEELVRLREDFVLLGDRALLVRRFGTWLGHVVQVLGEFADRRVHGQYPTDDFGFDRDFAILLKPLFEFMFDVYWRVEIVGTEHVPTKERVLLVANHSGLFCWDAFMVKRAMRKVLPHRRPIRGMINPGYFRYPFLGPFMGKLGMVPSFPENTRGLLERDQTVICFPGGDSAVPRDLRDPYRVPRFENCGHIEEALRTGAEIVPVAVVGSHESYPILFRLDLLGRMLGFPMLPVTPFFPFTLPPLWFVPMPVKWMVAFLPSVQVPTVSDPESIDLGTVMEVEDMVRDLISEQLTELLHERGGIFG